MIGWVWQKPFSGSRASKEHCKQKVTGLYKMNLFQTISESNYAILHPRFSNGAFTKYSGIRQTRLSINNGWQSK
jgi:hypothetical protein